MQYETKFAIGDLVYKAQIYGVERRVIDAIKIIGVNKEVLYGIEARNTTWVIHADRYSWFSEKDLFIDEAPALVRMAEQLKEEEERQAERKLRELKELEAEIESKKLALEDMKRV